MSSAAKERLIVHASGSRWTWLLLDRNGQVRQRGSSDPDRPEWPQERPMTVLVDAAACIGLKLDLPELPAARQAQALRWAAEEHLASSAEDEHVVAGPRADDGRLCCVVINQTNMSELQARLDQAPVEVMVPDALCLPWQPGQVSLTSSGDQVLARWGAWDFGAFESDMLTDMLAPVVPDGSDWVWFGEGEIRLPGDQSIRRESLDGLEAMMPQALAAPVNLLAGTWTPRSTQAARTQWRWAAGLAAGVVALVLVAAGVEHQLLKRQASNLQVAIDAQFHQAFPDVGRVVRHREQAERELARLRYGEAAGLLDLMSRAAPVIDAQEQIRLDGLNYRDGRLELSLRAPDVAALDQFERRLRALDLNASVQSASLDGEGASGRIRIAEGVAEGGR